MMPVVHFQAVLMGKPGALIYEAAAEILRLPPGDVLAIGDSIEHDIKGASLGGMDTLFIAGGIFADQLGIVSATSPDDLDMERVDELLTAEAVQATYCMTRLVA
jgi:ribonucleotide monophosphatase NagD (HAD superfamily)